MSEPIRLQESTYPVLVVARTNKVCILAVLAMFQAVAGPAISSRIV